MYPVRHVCFSPLKGQIPLILLFSINTGSIMMHFQ